MEEKLEYKSLEKKVQGNYTEDDYIAFFTYYFTKGYKEYTNEEKVDFYIELQSTIIMNKKIPFELFSKIDDMCEELDCGSAEVDPDYFVEFDKKFIKLFKEYGFLKDKE